MEKKIRQHRTKTIYWILCMSCLHLSVILHNSSLQGDSLATSSLYNLTKNLTAQYTHNLCAVLP